MNLALAWCGKEWRAQRGFLLGYAGLMFATVAAVLTLVHWHDGFLQGESCLAAVVLVFSATGAVGCVFTPRMIVCAAGVIVPPLPGPVITVSALKALLHGVFPTSGRLMIFPRFDVNFPAKV